MDDIGADLDRIAGVKEEPERASDKELDDYFDPDPTIVGDWKLNLEGPEPGVRTQWFWRASKWVPRRWPRKSRWESQRYGWENTRDDAIARGESFIYKTRAYEAKPLTEEILF